MNYLESIFMDANKKKENIFQPKKICYGIANKDKIFYFIEEDCLDAGFFAMYRWWLEYLYFADVCGYTPVICATHGFLYKEKEAVNNTKNPFEYYFIQPSGIGVQEARHSRQVILSDKKHREMVELILTGKIGNYKYNSQYLYLMARIVKRYIKFNHYTQDYIDEGLEKIKFAQEKMLGVHIRGTDFRAMYDNHPVYITEDECFIEIDKLLEKNEYSKVFLATDDERILNKFISRYKSRLCFYDDVERNDQNESVAFKHNTRGRNKYLLGLEVIRDMYTLSMCTGLVAGISQVAICAQIHKLSRKEKYKDIKIINKGIYSNQNFFSKRIINFSRGTNE